MADDLAGVEPTSITPNPIALRQPHHGHDDDGTAVPTVDDGGLHHVDVTDDGATFVGPPPTSTQGEEHHHQHHQQHQQLHQHHDDGGDQDDGRDEDVDVDVDPDPSLPCPDPLDHPHDQQHPFHHHSLGPHHAHPLLHHPQHHPEESVPPLHDQDSSGGMQAQHHHHHLQHPHQVLPELIDHHHHRRQPHQHQHEHQHEHSHPLHQQHQQQQQQQQQQDQPPLSHLGLVHQIDEGDATGQESLHGSPHHPSKKPRRRYDNNFKAEVLEHLQMPGAKLPAVAKQFNIPDNTLREWTKVSVVQAIEAARSKNSGQLKANMYDPMYRVTESVMAFFARNEQQPQKLRQPVTTKLIVAKGLEAKTNLLELDEIQPFLDPKEKKALESFTGSDSWAKKFAKRHDLKMTGARIKELEEDDVEQFHQSIKQMANRIKQAGPAYEQVATLLRQAGEKLLQARASTRRRTLTVSHEAQLTVDSPQHLQRHLHQHQHQHQQLMQPPNVNIAMAPLLPVQPDHRAVGPTEILNVHPTNVDPVTL